MVLTLYGETRHTSLLQQLLIANLHVCLIQPVNYLPTIKWIKFAT
jgi:hypothetical protein